MLRRSILELSFRRPVKRIPTQITTQISSYLSSRKGLSTTSQQNEPHGSGSTGKPSGSDLPKIVFGGVALGAAVLAAYQWDKLFVEEHREKVPESAKTDFVTEDRQNLPETNKNSEDGKHLGERLSVPNFQESNISNPTVDHPEEKIERKSEGESQFQFKDTSEINPQEDIISNHEKELPSSPHSVMTSDSGLTNSKTPFEDSLDMKSPEVEPDMEQHEDVKITPTLEQADAVPKETEMKSMPPPNFSTKDMSEEAQNDGSQQPSSLLDAYHLRDDTEIPIASPSTEHKDLVGTVEAFNDVSLSKDGKLVLDFLEAIHAAEKRQGELDACIFAEEKRMMKEKYEKELKDARARELMYAEREAILDKELNKERLKAAAALKSLQEKLEEKLQLELEQKETEAELKLKTMQELVKAELSAAIAREKASQIEKMAEANLNINALCMAFYARSEEARQSHSVHKLALGALALEDALSKGLPIKKEIDALYIYLEDIDKDSFLDLVLSSLPDETRTYGTDTLLQLNLKFDALKGTLRHFSLLPPGGGGILTHTLARVASWLKVKEVDQCGDGIESLINRVESLLAEGKLSEAADTLEYGVKGSEAAEIAGDWVTRARNRAITDQASTLLQSYAMSISLA